MCKKLIWKTIYYPSGEWNDDKGNTINITGNFRATFKNKKIIVVMSSQKSDGGHGEISFKSKIPIFIYKDTLKEVIIGKNEYINL